MPDPERPLRLILALGIAALACNLSGRTASPSPEGAEMPTPAGTLEAPGDESSPAPVLNPANLPPGDYYEAFLGRVETGEWTAEEGLLAILRSFAGTGEDPLQQVELGRREGTGVIREARRYLREGDDQVVRAEIESLLTVILPSTDRLMEYARPESGARSRLPGLAAPAMADPQCVDLYAKGFPPGQNLICYLVAQAPMGSEGVDVYYPADWASDPISKAFSDAALAAVLDSWNTYKGYGAMRSVNVVFAMLQSGGPSSLAEVPSKSGDVPCLIVVYPLALTDYNPAGSGAQGIDGFKQTIAHEMFHCFQGWNYPKHFDEWSVQRWWGEGSADYFSNVVYPTVNDEWGWFPTFVVRSADKTIFQMAYENSLFFQFLEKKIQPQGLISLFHLLPTGKPHAEHQKILGGYAGMSDYWHEFGRAVIDQKIVDTSGAPIPASRLPQFWSNKVGILASQTYDMPGRDFVLTRYDVALGGGLGYHVHVGQTDAENLHAARTMTGPPWSPVAIDRDGGCARYAVLVTSVGSSAAPRTFQIAAVVDQPNEGGVCDTCVLGRWRMTHASYVNIFQTVGQGATSEMASQIVTTGDLELEPRSDGTVLAEAMPFSVRTMGSFADVVGDPIYTEMNVRFSGSATMTYLAMEGEFLMTMVTPGIQTTSSVDIGGQVIEGLLEDFILAPFGSDPPGSQYHLTYTCSPTELRLTSTDAVFQGEPWVYQKVALP